MTMHKRTPCPMDAAELAVPVPESVDNVPLDGPAPSNNSAFRKAREFHRLFGLAAPNCPQIPSGTVLDLRQNLIAEELGEWLEACCRDDLIGAAQEITDLLYVVLGTAVSMGVDPFPILDEIHAANMRKAGGGCRADGKILKPPGWRPPDVAAVLTRQMCKADQAAAK